MEQISLSEAHIASLADTIKDWQFEHGSLLKAPPRTGKTLAYPIGVAAFPSNFPRTHFEQALRLQILFNLLYVSVASNEEWLHDALANLFDSDSVAKRLWAIHLAVEKEGRVQDVSLGIFRSDYMLHSPSGSENQLSLKQVEFNTYSVAGGAHSNKISNMHRYYHSRPTYQPDTADLVKGILLPREHMGRTALIQPHQCRQTTPSNHLRFL